MNLACSLQNADSVLDLLIERYYYKIAFTLFCKWAKEETFFSLVSCLVMPFRSPELVAVKNFLKCLDRHSSPSAVMLVSDEQTTIVVSQDPFERKYHDQYHPHINTGIILVAAGNAKRCHLQRGTHQNATTLVCGKIKQSKSFLLPPAYSLLPSPDTIRREMTTLRLFPRINTNYSLKSHCLNLVFLMSIHSR